MQEQALAEKNGAIILRDWGHLLPKQNEFSEPARSNGSGLAVKSTTCSLKCSWQQSMEHRNLMPAS